VDIYNQDWRVYLDAMNRMDFSIARAGLSFGSPDPFDALNWMRTGGLFNDSGWSDARYDALVAEAGAEGNLARRSQLAAQAETILNTELPVITLFWGRDNYLLDPQVKGWSQSVVRNPPFKHVYFESE
jgi:oligopeptide transport system substrate-binding protein